ncbi:hypothetical protein KSP40_PGU009938 [Platanthera guangdongensis]|uniref:Floricaula/leafy-like transcription factor n=1 Tax=Platanthera guangdongensis TaxID=2320717 RepID=A0ABR2LGU9_9ASPA
MDPGDAFSAGLFRWDPRTTAGPPHAAAAAAQPCPSAAVSMVMAASQQHHHHNPHEVALQQHPPVPPATDSSSRELEEVFEGYGVRYSTVARIGDLGFTASTLAGMREEEVDDMMATVSHLFRWDLLVGERYGIKAAIRAERRRLEALIFSHLSGAPAHLNHHQHQMGYLFSSAASTGHHLMPDDPRRRRLLLSPDHHNALDALSQEGLSEEPVQLEREAAGSGGGEVVCRRDGKGKNQQRQTSGKKKDASSTKSKKKKKKGMEEGDDDEEEMEMWGRGASIENDEEYDGEESQSEQSSAAERQREHPFIVTEPGEVARAKKNGLDYLFNLYEQCHEFLLQVQTVAKERGDKCPTKVTEPLSATRKIDVHQVAIRTIFCLQRTNQSAASILHAVYCSPPCRRSPTF